MVSFSYMKYIIIHGRQPEFAVAELEALVGPAKLQPINHEASFLNELVDFERIGSSVKLTQVLTTLPFRTFDHALDAAVPFLHATHHERGGKLHIGVSVYGRRISGSQINRHTLILKKKLRSKDLSVRLVPNKQPTLNAAQVLRNKLTKGGFELCLIFDQNNVHLARTLAIQDIDAYAKRDREKPVRDPLVGMLPPKLAQTLINLTSPKHGQHLLDPFCGSGTVLMEAELMGLKAHGSDISPDMVAAAQANIAWLLPDTPVAKRPPIELADACRFNWPWRIDAIAAETYLGPALRQLPEPKALAKIIDEVDEIHRAFLQNLAPQIKSGTKLALAVPAWRKQNAFYHLPVLDDLEKLGYNHIRFVHINRAAHPELVYHRPQQVVGRRVLCLIRK